MDTTDEQVDALFERFGYVFGARFTAELRGSDQADTRRRVQRAKGEWRETLAGLTAAQVEQGIRTAKFRCEWPPSHAEFVRYALGLPEAGQVVARVARGESDALVKAVCRAAGGRRNVTMVDQREQVRVVERVYGEIVERMVRDVADGHGVDPVARLECAGGPEPPRVGRGGQRPGDVIPGYLESTEQ